MFHFRKNFLMVISDYTVAGRAIGFALDTVAGKAIGFAPEQPLHVVALACSASGILKQLQ
jgi:hypothetical protein